MFDLWDFGGDPDYRCIYSCFGCSNSLHVVVCDARKSTAELVRWLSDIQSSSVERIPVVVAFTHMDTFKTREQNQEFRRGIIQWLDHQNKQNDTTNGAFSLLASMTETIKNLQGDEMLSSYEPRSAFRMQELCGEVIPLMPFVLKVVFVSNVTGDGIQSLRKCLYKVASGVLPHGLARHPGLQVVGQAVPSVYTSVEQLIRRLRNKFRSSRREGEQRPFYTVSELRDKLQRHLQELRVRESDFVYALKFLHEVRRK